VNDKRDYYRLRRGKPFGKEITRKHPKLEDTLKRRFTQLKSNHPLLRLGSGTDETQWLTEEERESHLHIVGTTGEGKSKLLEYLIRHDIDRGHGVCLLDPSDNGDTAYKVLKYCASIGHKKVVLIDPIHQLSYNRVCVLNPFHYHESLQETAISFLMDSVRVLFNQKDASDTPRVMRYLPALLSVLQKSKMTLHEAIYFTNYHQGARRRQAILQGISDWDRDVATLDEVFAKERDYQFYFASTINRLEPFFRSDYLDNSFGYPQGLDFAQLVRDGWVILVNLDADSSLDVLGSRLLGSVVINEILFAIKRMRGRGWKGVYYLYIDEAGEYATRRLARMLDLKRKTGLRVTFAHQYSSQFEDRKVLESVQNSAKIKIAFYVRGNEERLQVVKAMYGGNLPDKEVSYALSKLSKAQAVLQKPKQDAVFFDIPYTPDIEIPQEDLHNYIESILSNDWYRTPKQIKESYHERFRPVGTDSTPPQERKASDGKKSSRPRVPKQRDTGDKQPDVPQSPPEDPKPTSDPKKTRFRRVL
jgi:hypothetical protein